jgi:hypothetical protein
MLHFDNAPVHNIEGVQESLANFGFRRVESPPYSPDLALLRLDPTMPHVGQHTMAIPKCLSNTITCHRPDYGLPSACS